MMMKSLFAGAVVTLLVLASSSVHAQKLIRGPYLQMITPESVGGGMGTGKATTNYVRYGNAPTELDSVAFTEGLLTEHVVPISRLKPNTKYYYAVGTPDKTLAGGTTNYYFITS